MAPQSSNPPSLPPSVEEAYRRKCIQLRQRTQEIESENDAYRLRLNRLQRQIQKSRLERAFLLEQIAKRTSTNVEDSEGSPSPPPTPKDKPLRIKRGHRKQSIPGDANEPSSVSGSHLPSGVRGHSPSSETFSHDGYPARNGASIPKPPKRPSNAFEIYCNDRRPVWQAEHKDAIAAGEYRLEEELAKGWKNLSDEDKTNFQKRYEEELQEWKEQRDAYKRGVKEANARERSRLRADREYYGGGRGRVSASARMSEVKYDDDDDGDDGEDGDGDGDGDGEGDGDADQDQDQDVEMGDADADEQDGGSDNDTEPEDGDGDDQGDD